MPKSDDLIFGCLLSFVIPVVYSAGQSCMCFCVIWLTDCSWPSVAVVVGIIQEVCGH